MPDIKLYLASDVEALVEQRVDATEGVVHYGRNSKLVSEVVSEQYHPEDWDNLTVTDLDNLYTGCVAAAELLNLQTPSLLKRLLAEESEVPIPTEAEWMYLSDDSPSKLKEVLSHREFKKLTDTEFSPAVTRITLPPIERLGDEAHINILKFLIETASDTYNIEFDHLSESLFELIQAKDRLAFKGTHEAYKIMTGNYIRDSADLEEALKGFDNKAEDLLLRHFIPLWLFASKNLYLSGEFNLNGCDKLLSKARRKLTGVSKGEVLEEVGLTPAWEHRYDRRILPMYVGQPPLRVLSTCESKKPASAKPRFLRGTAPELLKRGSVPRNLRIPTKVKNLTLNKRKELLECVETVDALRRFHLTIMQALPTPDKLREVEGLLHETFDMLEEAEVSVLSVYRYPVKDIRELHSQLYRQPGVSVLDKIAAKIIDRN